MSEPPTFDQERQFWSSGYKLVAGVDEVGRGPLAGPVVAAAVIFSAKSEYPWLSQVRDSKKLTAKMRETLSHCIRHDALAFGIGVVPPDQIDSLGIVGATRMAMRDAVENLRLTPEALLIDALDLPELIMPQKSIIRGDALCLSIAAASIVAKVHRDEYMRECEGLYPGYGFARNMGYPTREHMERLLEIGCCPIHRTTFGPVRKVIERHV